MWETGHDRSNHNILTNPIRLRGTLYNCDDCTKKKYRIHDMYA